MKQRKVFAKNVATMACVLALGLGALSGCGEQATNGSATATEPAAEATETSEAQGESNQAGVANPWEVAQTAEETAQGAGLDVFGVPESVQVGGVEYAEPAFFFTSSIAQVSYSRDADTILLRKSGAEAGKEGLAGDYNEYAKTWTQDVDGIEVTCYGAKQEAAQLILWQQDSNNYSLGFGFGSDETPAMTPADVASIVGGIR